MQTSLIINATDTNGAVTKTVTDVNANTAGSVAHEYGRQLNALTTNNFIGVNRVDKEKLDSNKTTPMLTLAKTVVKTDEILQAADWYTVGITYDGDGQLSADFCGISPDGNIDYMVTNLVWTIIDGQLAIRNINNYSTFATGSSDLSNANLMITVRASETDTCNPVTAELTINALKE